ncbi:MAG: dockerin type I repeat-containing protein [Oscillospiraceae bacterium]|nr:dockerin type I repeat-containing protein [Oscillospiraceae bacterium]
MKFQKLIAVFTAGIVICHNYSVLSAFAEDEKIKIEIENKIISSEELENMNYEIPVFVNLTANAGINSAEFIISVDSRCDYEVITNSQQAFETGNKNLLFSMTSSHKFNDNCSRLLWAGSGITEDTGALVLLMVQIPEDAINGDVFEISYLPELNYQNYQFEHLWGIAGREIKNYATDNEVIFSNGEIKIQDDEPVILGDADENGAVDILDVIVVNKAILGQKILTGKQMKAVDFNQNGMVEPDESLMLMEFIVGLIDNLIV